MQNVKTVIILTVVENIHRVHWSLKQDNRELNSRHKNRETATTAAAVILVEFQINFRIYYNCMIVFYKIILYE